jgi:CRISPR-associated endonuclease/helicase Cas3
MFGDRLNLGFGVLHRKGVLGILFWGEGERLNKELGGKMEGAKNFVAHVRKVDKKIQTVTEHLIGTAEKSSKFADKIGMKEFGELIGLVHDLGKATELFNGYIMSAAGLIEKDNCSYVNHIEMKGKIDHSSAGGQYLYNHLNENEYIKQMLMLVIKSHHGGLIDCIKPDGENKLKKSINKDITLTRLKEAEVNVDKDILNQISKISEMNLTEKLIEKTKIINTHQSDEAKLFMLGLLIRFLFSCLIDADRQDTADFENPEQVKKRLNGNYVDWEILSGILEKHLSGLNSDGEINEIRKEISDTCFKFSEKSSGIFQLSVPTGGGKTLSSLRFSINHALKNKMDRIIYVVPFTTIIDQNAGKVREILEEDFEKGTVVLEHHSNLTPEKETDATKLLSENWDAPIVFTTMVQFLDSLFKGGTKSVRRMHQLANSIIIFDEVQSLDVKFVYMFNTAIKFLVDICHSSIILCTATQPLLDNIEPENLSLNINDSGKIINNTEKLYNQLSRTCLENRIRTDCWEDEEIIDLALKHLEIGENVLVISNTKKSALNLSEIIITDNRFLTYHLSTSMCPEHRMDVLSDMLKNMEIRDKPVICISTQLIEAGVDIDFDVVIRFAAGLDSIMQAAGRCNRNGKRKEKGKVYVVNPKNENLDRLKSIKIGKDITMRIMNEFDNNPEFFKNDLFSPIAIERYYQYYFYSRKEEMAYNINIKEYGVSENIFNLLSFNKKAAIANKNTYNDNVMLPYSFSTAGNYFEAIENNTYGVIVYYKEGENIINQLCSTSLLFEKQKLLKAAQRYSINIFSYQMDKFLKEKKVFETQKDSGIFYLSKDNYDDDFLGLINDGKMQSINI